MRFVPDLPLVDIFGVPIDERSDVGVPGGERLVRRRKTAGQSGAATAGMLDDSWFNRTVWLVDGRDQGGRQVASGTYLYVMKGPGVTESRRMLLVK